jgi:type IV secretion system protein VirB8
VRYPRTTTVDARVKSVSPIGVNAVLVRFDTIRTDANSRAQLASPSVAVIKYRYSTAPMSVEDRYVNPLGFQVTSYRTDPETVPTAEADQQAVSKPISAPDGGAQPSVATSYYSGASPAPQTIPKR